MNTDITIRLADADDTEALLNIYAPYVEATPITFEYTVPSVEEFRLRILHTLEKYPYLVAEVDQKIVGYTYASTFKGRAAYDWSVETSIYVDVEWRGCGIGHALYQVLEKWLTRQHVINVNACITYPNPGSVHFHRGFGYRQVARFSKCGYKLGTWHDVIWMEKALGKHQTPPEPVVWLADILAEERESEKSALEWKRQQTEKVRRRKLIKLKPFEAEPKMDAGDEGENLSAEEADPAGETGVANASAATENAAADENASAATENAAAANTSAAKDPSTEAAAAAESHPITSVIV